MCNCACSHAFWYIFDNFNERSNERLLRTHTWLAFAYSKTNCKPSHSKQCKKNSKNWHSISFTINDKSFECKVAEYDEAKVSSNQDAFIS